METQKTSKNPFHRISNLDLTSGNLFWKLGIFAFPIALTTILQLLYSTVDLASVHFWEVVKMRQAPFLAIKR